MARCAWSYRDQEPLRRNPGGSFRSRIALRISPNVAANEHIHRTRAQKIRQLALLMERANQTKPRRSPETERAIRAQIDKLMRELGE